MSFSIFDTNAHPTLTGRWGNKDLDASFEKLDQEVRLQGYRRACAVGLAGQESYDHARFAQACHPFNNLVPIAGCTLHSPKEMDHELGMLQDLGFKGVKLHPKDPRLDLSDPRFPPFLEIAHRRSLPVFLCTYLHSPLADYPSTDPLYQWISILKKVPEARVVLIHGGDVRLLQYAEVVRFNPNLLLDLSQTIMKYPGSSLDLDLRFLFESFDRRICIGTDFPEYSLQAVKKRFEKFALGLSQEKSDNIAFRNIETFLGLSE